MPEINNYICLAMKRRKLIPDPILMVISIICLTAFQLYWLKQNYSREEKTLKIKAESTFRETVMKLQVAKFKLDNAEWSGQMETQDEEGRRVSIRINPDKEKKEMVSTINVIRNKMADSLRVKMLRKPGMIISMNKTSMNTMDIDSVKIDARKPGKIGIKRDHIFNLLYGVDSLQDSLRVTEIDSAYTKSLKKINLAIPFSIVKVDSAHESDEPNFNEVTVGFANPITYKLQLGNTFPYLLKQITQPILFSIALLGITILSFALLYKNLLRQRKLGDVKNEFISNITHELKTPIATVGVAIEALKNFNAIDNPERTREYLDISQNELQRLSLLVDKVLKLSMFEKKEVELKYEIINLHELVNEVASSLKLQLEKYRARISITQEGDLTLQGDRLHLLSVIFNLVDNALKYSKGEPSIVVDLKGDETNVIMSIKDNGIGIAPEYKTKIFDKFFRVPHGDTHDAKGYGLGLSYAAQVIQKHKGTIDVESQPGIGTKFTITLPKSNT